MKTKIPTTFINKSQKTSDRTILRSPHCSKALERFKKFIRYRARGHHCTLNVFSTRMTCNILVYTAETTQAQRAWTFIHMEVKWFLKCVGLAGVIVFISSLLGTLRSHTIHPCCKMECALNGWLCRRDKSFVKVHFQSDDMMHARKTLNCWSCGIVKLFRIIYWAG